MSSVLGGFLERAASEALGFAVGTSLSSSLNPEAVRLSQEAWHLDPNMELDPQTAALASAKGVAENGEMAHEAEGAGLDGTRFAHLVRAAYSAPGISELLELHRRARLDLPGLRDGLRQSLLDPRWHDDVIALTSVLISPQDLAMARQQGFVDAEEARARSVLQGVEPDDADLLFEMSGLPLGLGEALDLVRRGEKDEAWFAQVLREGHTKTKYTADALLLRKQVLSPSVYAEALIRQRITEGEAVRGAALSGLERSDFLLWSNMLGRPIATGQALQLARRGEFTFAQFKEAVARSDVRTEYADDLWKLRRTLPNLFTLRALVSAGALTDNEAIGLATDLGYDHFVAVGIVNAAKRGKTQHTRDLAATQIDALFESGLETREWALAALEGLGYDPDESEWHLELLEARRLLSALQSDLNTIHRTYVNHKIDRNQASNELDSLQMRTEARDLMLEVWDNERAANVAVLTNAEIGRALHFNIITEADAISRWKEHGYSSADAQIKADIVLKRGRVAPPSS